MCDGDPQPIVVDQRGTVGTAEREPYGWELDLSSGSGRLEGTVGRSLLAELVDAIANQGGGYATWRVADATEEHRQIASSAGFDGSRRIVNMRRALPAPWSSSISTRPFRPSVDDAEWLRLNHAAFDWHPEQGGWDHDDLARRLAEPWFDHEGFLLHPDQGPLDGFCWTKVHTEHDPPMGEIFVIGVHPDAAGRGLGRELVLAGLDHLTGLGLSRVMLYTEVDNVPARALYDRLGFEVHHEVTVFGRAVPAGDRS